MADKLRFDYINNLPQLFTRDGFPVYDFEVETGLFRIDVVGLLQVKHISDEIYFLDEHGCKYATEKFYIDYEEIGEL